MTEPNKLGNTIRKHRLDQRLTLEQVSKMTGLSKSFLSQTERGLTTPSVASLKKIAKQFGFSVVNFFSEEDKTNSRWDYHELPQENNGSQPSYIEDIKVVRVDRRKKIALPGSNIIYDLLSPDLNRKLEVLYMHVTEGDISGEEPMMDPPGEKVGIVLKGCLLINVGGSEYELNEGDSIYYPTNVPHSWKAIKHEETLVIWILTPPSF